MVLRMGDPSSDRQRQTSVARNLAMLCAVLALPMVLLIGSLAWLSAQQNREAVGVQVRGVATSAINAFDREVEGQQSKLEVLAALPMGQADRRAFYQQARNIAASEQAIILLTNATGQVLMRTDQPFRGDASTAGRPKGSVATKPTIGDLEFASPGKAQFTISVPVGRDGMTLSAILSGEKAIAILNEVLPSTFWAGSLSDRTGTVVARTKDNEKWVGKQITEPLRQALETANVGTWDGPSHEGEPLLGGFARSARTGWIVAVGVKRSELASPTIASPYALTGALALLALLAGFSAWFFARRLANPLRDLALRAQDLAEGRPVATLTTGIKEMDAVSQALAGADDAIASRDSALRTANQQLETINLGLEEEVARRAKQAEESAAMLFQAQKMESLGRLIGSVAHDFNNLLTPILGSLDLLNRKGVGNERERRLIDGALQSAERAKTLVQRLLAFARRQPLQASAVDVERLVTGLADLIETTLGPTIVLRLNLAPGLPAAKADPNQLEMAVLNLAVNARDAMPGGGELTIAAKREEVTAKREGLMPGEYLVLTVTDTGCGMDEETRRRAFEPFFSTKEVGKGTGLGLSMVHGLMAQLGGGLTIDSRLRSGTSVALWMPVSVTSRAVFEKPELSSPISIENGTALLVDDEDLVRRSTSDMLAALGFRIVEAASGEEALQLVRSGFKPDILITDHLMPGISGTDLVKQVRALTPGLPALVVSGYAEVEGIDTTMPRLTKPFRSADLAASITALWREQRGTAL